MRESRARTALAFCAVVIVSFLLRGTALGQPETRYFDEVYYVYTAQLLAQGDARGWEWWHQNPEGVAIEWTHPPVAKLLIAASIRLLGDHPVAWRLPGALAVALASGILFLLGRTVFRTIGWGLIAAALFTFDLLPFVQARIATPEALLYLFTALVFLAAARAARTTRWWWLLALGLAGGALLATKWNGVVTAGLATLLAACSLQRAVRQGRWRPGSATLAAVGFLVVLPLAVYLLAFVPFFTSGHNLETFKELHQQMYWYHSRLDATHPYQSRFWEWPLIFRSIWYFTETDAATGAVANIYALGNPALWWPGVAAMLWLAFRSLSRLLSRRRGKTFEGDAVGAFVNTEENALAGPAKRDALGAWLSDRPAFALCASDGQGGHGKAPVRRSFSEGGRGTPERGSSVGTRSDGEWDRPWQDPLPVILVAAYLLLWLPYALSPRVMFLYHYLPASLIALLGVVLLLREVSARRHGRWMVAGYLVVVLGVFAVLSPLAAGVFIPPGTRDALLWLPGWR